MTTLRAPDHDQDLSPGLERYLLAALTARQRDAVVTSTSVARVLNCSTPTSLEMLRRLERAGYLVRDPSRRAGWQLTADGQRELAALRRRQSVVEHYLRAVLGLTPEEAAEEAARLGPAVSSGLEARLRDAIWPATRPCRAPV